MTRRRWRLALLAAVATIGAIWPISSLFKPAAWFAEAAVMGVDDEQFGQRLSAFVVLHNPVTVDALKAHVRDNLANYKVPRDITILDELPRNSTGKIDRRALQDRLGG